MLPCHTVKKTLGPWVQRKASGLAEAEREKSPVAMAVTALEKLTHQGQGAIERVPACVPVLLGPRCLPGLAWFPQKLETTNAQNLFILTNKGRSVPDS